MSRIRRASASENGFSLVELLVIAGVMGFVVLTAMSLIFPTLRFSSQVAKNMSSTVDNDLGARVLASELRNSYLMRLSAISCGSTDQLFKTASSSPLFQLKDGGTLSFINALYSGSGARDPQDSERLSVADPDKFPNGSVILATSQNSSAAIGVFRVTASDNLSGRIKVKPVGLVDNPTPCQNSGASSTLENLFKVSKSEVINLHRIRISHYKRAGDVIYRGSYPEDGASTTSPKAPAFERISELSIQGKWQSYGSGNVGRWFGEVGYKYELPSLLENAPKRIVRSSSKVSFDLGTSLRSNTQVQTTAELVEVIYPTCSVSMAASPLELELPSQYLFGNSRFFVVDGHSSINRASSITVDFTLGKDDRGQDSFLSCYPLDAALASNPRVSAAGVSGTLTLMSSGGEFSRFLCAARGEVILAGSMLYFDPLLRRQVVVRCSGMSVVSGMDFRHRGNQRADCFRDGRIDFGAPLVISGTNKPGPTLYVNNRSCRWSDSGANFVECDANRRNPNARLEEVRLLPYGLDNLKSSSGYYEISCR